MNRLFLVCISLLISVFSVSQETIYDYYGFVYNIYGKKIDISSNEIQIITLDGLNITTQANKYSFSYSIITNGLSIEIQKKGFKPYTSGNHGYAKTSLKNSLLISKIMLIPINTRLIGKTFIFYDAKTGKAIDKVSYKIIETEIEGRTDNGIVYIKDVKAKRAITFKSEGYQDRIFKKRWLREKYKQINIKLTQTCQPFKKKVKKRKYKKEMNAILKILYKMKENELTMEDVSSFDDKYKKIKTDSPFSFNLILGYIYLDFNKFNEAYSCFVLAERNLCETTNLDKEIVLEIEAKNYFNGGKIFDWLKHKIVFLEQKLNR